MALVGVVPNVHWLHWQIPFSWFHYTTITRGCQVPWHISGLLGPIPFKKTRVCARARTYHREKLLSRYKIPDGDAGLQIEAAAPGCRCKLLCVKMNFSCYEQGRNVKKGVTGPSCSRGVPPYPLACARNTPPLGGPKRSRKRRQNRGDARPGSGVGSGSGTPNPDPASPTSRGGRTMALSCKHRCPERGHPRPALGLGYPTSHHRPGAWARVPPRASEIPRRPQRAGLAPEAGGSRGRQIV